MANIGTISSKLGLSTSDFNKGLKEASANVRRWSREAARAAEKNLSPLDRHRRKIAQVNFLHKAGKMDARAHADAIRNLTRQYRLSAMASSPFVQGLKDIAGTVGGIYLAYRAINLVKRSLLGAARASEEFNQAMNSSLAIMGDISAQGRTAMSAVAFDVAFQTKFDPAETGAAYYYLASAGLDAAQSLKALPAVATFAQAGMFDLSKATELLTDAQSALGMSSKDAGKHLKNMIRVGDVLVKANTLANASVEQFSEALTTKAGAALKMVGKDIEEGVAILAAFADQGVKSSEAGVALNIVFRDLQTKAIKNAEAFREYGIRVYDAAGEMRNMADIIGDVERALSGFSDIDKKATLLELGFSDKSVIFLQTLLGTSDAIREYEAELLRAAGTMDDVAGKQLTDFAEGWHKTSVAIKEASVAMMNTPLGELGKGLSEAGEYLRDFAVGWKLLQLRNAAIQEKTGFNMDTAMMGAVFGIPGFLAGGFGGGKDAEANQENFEDAKKAFLAQIFPGMFGPEGQGKEPSGPQGDAIASTVAELQALAEAVQRSREAMERQTESLMASHRAQKRAAEQAEKARGLAIREDANPLIAFHRKMDDLDRLLSVGALGRDSEAANAAYMRQRGLYMEQYMKARVDRLSSPFQATQLPSAAIKGSAEAYSAIVNAQMKRGTEDPLLRMAKQDLALQKQANAQRQQMLEKLEPDQPVKIAPGGAHR